jgi:hypothetical protein
MFLTTPAADGLGGREGGGGGGREGEGLRGSPPGVTTKLTQSPRRLTRTPERNHLQVVDETSNAGQGANLSNLSSLSNGAGNGLVHCSALRTDVHALASRGAGVLKLLVYEALSYQCMRP